jgi:hypothetical protein
MVLDPCLPGSPGRVEEESLVKLNAIEREVLKPPIQHGLGDSNFCFAVATSQAYVALHGRAACSVGVLKILDEHSFRLTETEYLQLRPEICV